MNYCSLKESGVGNRFARLGTQCLGLVLHHSDYWDNLG